MISHLKKVQDYDSVQIFAFLGTVLSFLRGQFYVVLNFADVPVTCVDEKKFLMLVFDVALWLCMQ